MTLIYLGLAWVFGIYFGSRAALPPSATLLALAAASAFTLLCRKKRDWLLVGLCLIAFLGGSLRFQATITPVNEHSLQFYNDKGSFEISGIVDAYPEPGEKTTRLRLLAREIKVDGKWQKVSGAALVYAPKFPSWAQSRDFPYYRYGDLLKIEGNLETPPEFEDFSYQEYLARQGIHSITYHPEATELVASGQGLKPLEWLYHLRSSMSQALTTALPEPQGSLAQAILLGLRGTIPAELMDAFSKTGTAHIIAISGLHITIVAGMLLSIGVWLFGRGSPLYILIAFSAIWGYSILAGMHPSALRAVIMGSLFLLADWVGRPRSAMTPLALAAAVMVAIEPQVLWDVAFQLSFAAMAGLVLLAPVFQSQGRRALAGIVGEEKRGVVASIANITIDSFSITSGAIIATLAIIAFNFHRISLVGLPATFFALQALPGVIVTAALVGGIGLVSPALAQVAGWVAWLFLTYMIKVVELFSAIPLASLDIGRFGEPLVWLYYGVLAGLFWLNANRKRLPPGIARVKQRVASVLEPIKKLPTKWVVLPLAIVAILVWLAVIATPDSQLRVSFLDVGQGDAILIQTPAQQDILIDGGPSPEAINLQLGKMLPFWDRTIDLVVLTHPHHDHLAGLVEVLRRYEVKQVLQSDLEHTTSTYLEWLRLIEEKGIKCTFAQAGQYIDLGQGIRLEVLHPQATLLTGTTSDLDNNSVVLRLIAGETSFLLSGDIQEEAEIQLLSQGVELKSTVLKVAHHGSNTSTSPEFLAAVDPQVTVISVGAENRFGHPSPEVLERLIAAEIYRTDEQGTIEFTTDGERLWMKTGNKILH